MIEITPMRFFFPTHHMLGIKDVQHRGRTEKHVTLFQSPASARVLLAPAFFHLQSLNSDGEAATVMLQRSWCASRL